MAKNLFIDLMSALKEATSTTIKKHESSNVVKFIRSSIEKIENIIKTLDKILKKEGIDIGVIINKGKEKGKKYLEQGRKLLLEAKEKGFINTAKEKIKDLKSKLTNVFQESNKTGTSPPEENNLSDDSSNISKKITSNIISVKEFLSNNIVKPKESIRKNTILEDESKEKPSKPNWISKAFARAKKRKDEVEEEKKLVQERAKKSKSKDNGWLGKILGAISSLGGFLITGIKGALGFLGGFLLKGLGKAITSIIPGISTTIAKTTSALIGGGIKTAAKLTWSGAKIAAKAAVGIAKPALGILARGAAMIATGPIGWTIAIGTAIYGGYKLYKYLTRNNIANNLPGKLTRLRLLMYGFDDTNKEYYSKIFDLEMLMKDLTKFNNNTVTIDKIDNDTSEKILDIFSIKREDTEKYQILNTWLINRFRPVYMAFMRSLYSINNFLFLDELDKLRNIEILTFASEIRVPATIYDVKQIPTIQNSNTNVTKETVDALLVNIINEAKSKIKDDTKDPIKKIEKDNKKQTKNYSTETPTQPTPKPVKNIHKTVTSIRNIDKNIPSNEEGESKPIDSKFTDNKVTENINNKVTDKLNKTSGELISGDMSLEGIQTKLPKEKIYNLDPNVRELFTGMAKEYNSLTGKSIPVSEAFRTFKDQQYLYNKSPGKAARPGTSTHEYGLAIDIDPKIADELDKLGLLRKYGFTRPIGGEKWHLEPIGVSIEPNLVKDNQEYRHKAILASPGKGGDGYGTLDNSKLKGRDIEYQKVIYKENSENIIDQFKILAKNNNIFKLDLPEDNIVKTTFTRSNIIDTTNTKSTISPTFPISQVNKNNSLVFFESEEENKPSIRQNTQLLDVNKPVTSINNNIDISKYTNLSPEEAIKQASRITGVNEDIMLAYAKMESSLKGGSIKNKNSSATGLFQIVDSTWRELVAKYGPKYGIPRNAKPDNNLYNAILAAEYAKANLANLPDYKLAGIDEATAVYLAHHYGLIGAKKIINQLKNNSSILMKDIVGKEVYLSNRAAIGNSTIRDYVQKVSNKIDSAITDNSYTSKTIKNTTPIDKSTSSELNFSSTTYTPIQSPYKTIDTKPLDTVNNQYSHQIIFNTKNMENLMTDQLSALMQIATILNSIHDKIDISKLKELVGNCPQQPPKEKSIPKGSVNLSNKIM